MTFPVSAAMDATATGGGPGTFLNWIINGNPSQILKQVTDLLAKANEFAQLYDQLKQAGEQLRKVWRGPASGAASKKITTLLDSFTKIISVVKEVAQKLGLAASIIQKAQLAFKSIVAAINPTVSGLMSNPWTYAAAVALSTATSGALKGFLAALGALLKSLGAVELAAKLTTMAEVIGHLEKLVGLVTGKDPATGAGSAPGGQQVPAPAGQQPTTLPAKDFTGYQPPALGATAPGNGQNMWIPVDPAAPAPGTPAPSGPPPGPPAPAPSVPSGHGAGGGVSVTVTTGEGSATVTAPSGRDTIVNATVGNTPIKVAIDGDGDGKVSA
ncbi:WXG100 family type VII secretion target [Crossiella sp. S99.2]|uniref:WXG100 family type VII secretion target n=1 Tax=unclassified Crossiella TaxID=2620835 RepID=UPI0035AB76BA